MNIMSFDTAEYLKWTNELGCNVKDISYPHNLISTLLNVCIICI